MAAPSPNRKPPSKEITVNCQPPIWLAAAGISQRNGSVSAITQSADLPMLASMKPVRALITSATARTVQILARCAAKPKRPANRQASDQRERLYQHGSKSSAELEISAMLA